MKRAFAIGVAASMVLAAFATASNADPMKELEVYKAGLGMWNCDAKDLGSGKMFKATAEFTAELDGNTYIERYKEVASADHPSAWKGVFLMSYDPQTSRWVRNGVDNSGERNAASSSGWQDNTWTWEADWGNVIVMRKTEKTRNFAIDVKDNGNIKRVVEASCKRI
jgi:hypothetical protein